MSKSWPAVAGMAALTLTFASCGDPGSNLSSVPQKPKPPISTAFRDSLVGKGKVLLIRNDSSNETFKDIVVRVARTKGGDSSKLFREVAHDFKPGQTVSVGWMELNGWILEAGEQIDIYCHGAKDYATVSLRVPEKPSN